MRKILLITLALCGSIWSQAQQRVTFASLLGELTDRGSIARFNPADYVVKQVSSYDRHSIAPDKLGWFANEDHTNFLRVDEVNGHKEHVMMDEDGPGAIVRFWETTFKRPGVLRIYFDNQTEASITIPGYDLMKFPLNVGEGLLIPHSSYEPEAKGGSSLYLPLPYKKHCKVTWEDPQEPIEEKRYYQINFRKYPAGTNVETFSNEIFKANEAIVREVNNRLLSPGSGSNARKISHSLKVGGKQTADILLPKGGNAISFVQLMLNDAGSYNDSTLRLLYLKAEFDGERTVYCPISDFFGSGAGSLPVQSWYRIVTDKGEMESYWIMPYQHNAKMSIVNKNNQPVSLSLTTATQPWKWDSNSLYFHTDWRYQANVPIKHDEGDHPMEWDLVKISGEGVFAGETLAVNNHMHKWYGEGDQKLWVDGERFPSEYGTGLEDYYNTSWAPVVIYQSPFANATRADAEDSFGQNTFTRTRNLDAVPFKKQFHYNVEMLGWENGSGDFAATVYWYGKKGAKNVTKTVDK